MARVGAHRGHGATRGAALADLRVRLGDGYKASDVTRTSTVAECAEGGRRVANGVRQSPRGRRAALHGSAYRGRRCGCEGAIPCSAAGGGAEIDVHGSPLQRCVGEACVMDTGDLHMK
jgi:hypothetical protein